MYDVHHASIDLKTKTRLRVSVFVRDKEYFSLKDYPRVLANSQQSGYPQTFAEAAAARQKLAFLKCS